MTRRDLALSLLQEAGPRGVCTAEFMDAGVGSRYSARLLELRKAGHSITSERVREGSWRYTLDAEVGGDGLERPELREARGSDPLVTVDLSAGVEDTVEPTQMVDEGTDATSGPRAKDAALKLFESAA